MSAIVKYWYRKHPLLYVLLPLSLIYRLVVSVRRWLYRRGIFKVYPCKIPTVVVGNITVGGNGKTPLVIWLAHYLKQQGYHPGIVSRGYGGGGIFPQLVTKDSPPNQVGDEPVLMAKRTGCPVVVDPNRVNAIKFLLKHNANDVIISDDGMQHYAMARHIEIAVIDGKRRYANGFCLPAGPLREPKQRLKEVEFIVANGMGREGEYNMTVRPVVLRQVCNSENTMPLTELKDQEIHALAGIGYPKRFFNTLRQAGLKVIPNNFPDHHPFKAEDIDLPGKHILMTEKDAVKCHAFADERHWYLEINVDLPETFAEALLRRLQDL